MEVLLSFLMYMHVTGRYTLMRRRTPFMFPERTGCGKPCGSFLTLWCWCSFSYWFCSYRFFLEDVLLFSQDEHLSNRSMMSKNSSVLLRPLARITHGFLSSGGETSPTAGG
jgi:hypothetical protein